MDQRDDYADLDSPPAEVLLRRWYDTARNLLVAVGLVVFALFLAGVVLVRVVEFRGTTLPKVPDPDPAITSDPV